MRRDEEDTHPGDSRWFRQCPMLSLFWRFFIVNIIFNKKKNHPIVNFIINQVAEYQLISCFDKWMKNINIGALNCVNQKRDFGVRSGKAEDCVFVSKIICVEFHNQRKRVFSQLLTEKLVSHDKKFTQEINCLQSWKDNNWLLIDNINHNTRDVLIEQMYTKWP